jgi:hypothetical protein
MIVSLAVLTRTATEAAMVNPNEISTCTPIDAVLPKPYVLELARYL